MKEELGHRYIDSNPKKGDSDYPYAEVEIIAPSPSKMMAKIQNRCRSSILRIYQ
jgi:hypothetical protein